jgi:ArsR family transcriptional regulator, arsenate/arsenite/antimonite-responsive transcriptional repressor
MSQNCSGYRRSAMDPHPAAPCTDDELATMSKALGHPVRVTIMRVLAARDTCVTGDLVAELPLAQSTVSEHLRILRQAGLVQGEIEGPRTRYCIDPTGLAALKAGIRSL